MAQTVSNRVMLVLQDGMRFEAANAARATTILDTVPEFGGSGSGLTPMEHLLAGLAGCTAMDVIGILRKKRQDVTDYRIEVEGARSTEHPKVYTEIGIRHIVTGRNLSDEAVRHAIELSEEKYCSAMAMLRNAVPIFSSFEVRNEVPVAALA